MSPPDAVTKLHLVDTDVHNDLPSFSELKPYLATVWHAWLHDGRPASAERAYANTGPGIMVDSVREEDGLCAGDPDWVVEQLIRKYRIDLGVLTGTLIGASVQHDARFWAD